MNEIATHWNLIESVIFKLADTFNIQIEWDSQTALLTGVVTVAGGLIGGLAGGYVGGKEWAVYGAGIGGATGWGVSHTVSLRQIWHRVKERLTELYFMVINFLRRLDPEDYVRAVQILMACMSERRALVVFIVEFIADKLHRRVTYSQLE